MNDGKKLFMDLAEVINDNQTEKLWCEGDSILTPDEKVYDAIQLIFDSIGLGSAIVTGYYDPKEDERDECVDGLTGNYYIELA